MHPHRRTFLPADLAHRTYGHTPPAYGHANRQVYGSARLRAPVANVPLEPSVVSSPTPVDESAAPAIA